MLQTTEQIKVGSEILVDYGAAFWDAWAKRRDAMDETRREASWLPLAAWTMSGHRVPHVGTFSRVHDVRSFFLIGYLGLSFSPAPCMHPQQTHQPQESRHHLIPPSK